MFLRMAIKRNREDELKKLRRELDALKLEVREHVESHEKGEMYTNEDGEKVPMSQVISEYLYGKEEGEG